MCCLGHSLDGILSVGEDKLCRFICDDASGIVTNVIYGMSIIFMNGIVLTANHVIEGSGETDADVLIVCREFAVQNGDVVGWCKALFCIGALISLLRR